METFAYLFAADGVDFFMITTGLTEEDVARQAFRIVQMNPTTSLRSSGKGFEITDSERQRVWRWVKDSEVK